MKPGPMVGYANIGDPWRLLAVRVIQSAIVERDWAFARDAETVRLWSEAAGIPAWWVQEKIPYRPERLAA